MDTTLFSLLTSAIVGSFFILIATLLCRRNKFIMNHGISFVLYLMIASIVRLIFIFELPFTKVFSIPRQTLPPFRQLYYPPALVLQNIEIIWLDIITVIWITIALFLFIKLCKNYYTFSRVVKDLPQITDPRVIQIFQNIFLKTEQKKRIRLVQSVEIDRPLIIGICSPIIVLPDLTFTDDELYIILSHECTHFRMKDTLIKLITEIICAIYWWNPFVYLLRNNLDHVLEMRCDAYVVNQLETHQRLAYVDVILKICRRSVETVTYTRLVSGLTRKKTIFGKSINTVLSQRVSIIFEYRPLKYNQMQFLKLGYVVLVLCIFTSSLQFVFQPKADSTYTLVQEYIEENPDDVIITKDNSYILENERGDFELHIDGKFYESIDESFKDILVNDGEIRLFHK